MKKITYLLIAAISLLSVASCVKEIMPEPALEGGLTGQVFTISLPDAETRTSLIMNRKTVWAEGDSLWVSNGVESEAVVVPTEAWDRNSFDFATKTVKTSEENPHIWVVYPYLASAGVADGKVKVKIPAVQDGEFGTANICAAESWGYHIELKNVTAVMKVTVPEDTEAAIYSISISAANSNPLTGTCSVDFSGDKPVVIPPASAGSNLSIPVDGFAKTFYVSVIPGTYDAGFRLLAATTDFAHASEVKETTVSNTLNVNDMVDLGTIGTNLQPLSGEGTEASPWLLESLGHVIAFSGAVNDGETFAGQHVKLGADISGITAPIGSQTVSYSSSVYTVSGNPFKGHFDGAGHTMTVNISAATAGRSSWVGLFGGLGDGAVVENLVIAGNMAMGGCNNIGALAGSIYSDTEGVTVRNVTNKAEVRGNNNIGGLVGQVSASTANLLVIENCRNEGDVLAGSYGVGGIVGRAVNKNVNKTITGCSNSGKVSGQYQIGGILGFGYYAVLTDCTNSGEIACTNSSGTLVSIVNKAFSVPNTSGAGGIGGHFQNCSITSSENGGAISGPNKIGGILAAAYWTNVTRCTNTGAVTSTGNCVGGITGWSPAQGNHRNCINQGAVSGKAYVGGIEGYADMGSSSGSAGQKFYSCVNEGDVTSGTEAAGGIIGCTRPYSNTAYVQVNECVNKGTISVLYRAGGIVGAADVYLNSAYTVIRNCENSGTVASVRTDADNGCVLGGICGWAVKKPTNAGAGVNIYNCLNSGKVQYAVSTFKNVYCGGIIGWQKAGTIANCCNLGAICSAEDVQAEGIETRLGSIVGQLDNLGANSFISECYSKAGVATYFAGTSGVSPETFAEKCANVSVFDAEGLLDPIVVLGSDDAYTIDEALNLWVSKQTGYTYYTWAWGDTISFVKE